MAPDWKKVVAVAIVIMVSLGVDGVIIHETQSSPISQISLQIDSNGGLLDNITVACPGCVAAPDGLFWQAHILLGDIPLELNDSTGASSAFSITDAYAIPLNETTSCSGYETPTLCVYALTNTPLPWNLTLDIQQLATGGVLKAKVYQFNGNSFTIPAESGNISELIQIKSANGYEPVSYE
jgi:hypothetical protein